MHPEIGVWRRGIWRGVDDDALVSVARSDRENGVGHTIAS